jgi:hypothetical protein
MGVASRPVEWVGSVVGKYPFRAAGALAALAGGAVTYAALGPGATLADLVAFGTAHPAYPAAAVIGLLVLLFFEG